MHVLIAHMVNIIHLCESYLFVSCRKKGGPNIAPPGRFCLTVRLPDAKNKDKDLYFNPEQSFKSKVEAEHAACLLALFHFEPTRPHEKRLPEPFKSMWLSLCGETRT